MSEKKSVSTRDLANIIRDNTGILVKDAENAVKEVFKAIGIAFENGAESVHIKGYLKISKKHRGKRMGRNPRTGTPIEVPEHTTLAYKTGTFWKDIVNKS